jgi:hypothetical protein
MLGLMTWTAREQRHRDREFYADPEQGFLQLAEEAEHPAKANPKDSVKTYRQVAALRKEATKWGQMSRASIPTAAQALESVEQVP